MVPYITDITTSPISIKRRCCSKPEGIFLLVPSSTTDEEDESDVDAAASLHILEQYFFSWDLSPFYLSDDDVRLCLCHPNDELKPHHLRRRINQEHRTRPLFSVVLLLYQHYLYLLYLQYVLIVPVLAQTRDDETHPSTSSFSAVLFTEWLRFAVPPT